MQASSLMYGVSRTFLKNGQTQFKYLIKKGRVYIDMANNVLYTLRDSKNVFTYAIMIY